MAEQPAFNLDELLQIAKQPATAIETEITVSQLNQKISTVLDRYADFSRVWITGEISNCKPYPSGHIYFVLKDQSAQLSCTIFSNRASQLKFTLKEGQQVRLQGKASLYAPSGRFQFLVHQIELTGSGALYAKYLDLKNRLEREGLFVNQRPLPKLPKRVGVITSPKGAVIQDICNVTFRRFPSAKILLYPAAVQGSGASEQLTAGIRYFQQHGNLDVIIIARGGGSIEDLWCFNDENLVRAIHASNIPVVSGVGHETDYTLCDFAADHRAPTPSAAAELVWPHRQQLLYDIQKLNEKLQLQQNLFLQHHHMRLSSFQQRYSYESFLQFCQRKQHALMLVKSQLERYNPHLVLESQKNILTKLQLCLDHEMNKKLAKHRTSLAIQQSKLKDLDPHAILQRGYAIITDANGEIVRNVQDVQDEAIYTWSLQTGQVDVKIKKVKER